MNAPPQQPEAVARLREILKPGDTVHCVKRHTSRSGASRSVSLFVSIAGELVELDMLAAVALGQPLDRKHGGLRVYTVNGGVFVDPGASLVSLLSNVLGYPLRHRGM
jgi:hypothetical protein